MVDGNIVICDNCKNNCSEDDEFCPECHFRLKTNESREVKFNENTNDNKLASMSNPYIEKTVANTNSILQKNKTLLPDFSQDIIENSDHSSEDSLNVSVLRTEAEYNAYILRVYLLGSLPFLMFPILLLFQQIPNSELYVLIGGFLVLGFLIMGPMLALSGYLSFKEQLFFYNAPPQVIAQELMANKFYFVKQNNNHYIFKKDKGGVLIVLVLEKDFFLLFAPSKVRNRFSKFFGWSPYY